MSDISTMVKAYYDNVAEPVTADEILNAPPVADPRLNRRPIGLPNWAIAAAVAVVVLAIVGAASLLLSGSDGSSIPVAPTETTIAPEPDLLDADVVTTTVAGQDATTDTQASVWMNNSWGVLLSVTPPLLPPVRGTYDVTVHGFHSGEQDGVWVTSCPGAGGVVNADAWQPAEEPWGLDSMCALGEDHPVATGDFIDGVFETIVRVEIDETAIEDGGVVITTGDIWVPVAGNVLLRIGDEPQTPWEEAYDGLNMSTLTQMISYWPPFVVNFDATYNALRSCEEAYASANDGQDNYLESLATWDDTQRDKPGYKYDKAVARLIASDRWLHDHTCPGRFDFTSVG